MVNLSRPIYNPEYPIPPPNIDTDPSFRNTFFCALFEIEYIKYKFVCFLNSADMGRNPRDTESALKISEDARGIEGGIEVMVQMHTR